MLYKRGKVWYLKTKWNGQTIRKSTGTTSKELARKIQYKVQHELAEGKWFDRDPAEQVFFREVWEKYINEEAKYRSSSTYSRAQQCAKNFLPLFGDYKLSQITPSVLSTYKAKRLESKVSMTTVVKELSCIRRVFSLCKREWQLCKQSPFEFFTMPKENPPRVRFLRPGQFEKILQKCPSWLKPMVIMARYTGMRRGNVLTLTWEQVDFPQRVINLEYTKNGERLTIPISSIVYNMLTSMRTAKVFRLNCPYVFHDNGKLYSPGQVSVAFKRACKRAEIEDFRFHDLRHDFASNLVQKGTDLYPVQLLMGHKDGRMTQRYAHLKVDHLRDAVEMVEPLTMGAQKGAQ